LAHALAKTEKLATQIAGVFRTPMPALQGDGNLLLG
jgi:hypothetical protein